MEITPDIVEVKVLEQYQIYLKFSNGEEKIYDMKENIEKIKYFNKLKNRKYFEKVKKRGETNEREKGEDIDPEKLYYESIPIKK